MARFTRNNSRGRKGFGINLPKFNRASLTEKKNLYYKKSTVFIKRRPMASFFIALGILFALIILNSLLTPKPKETAKTTPIKEVAVYKIGSAPRATFSAKVDKEGVIQIVAQTPGIVSSINVWEGQQVGKGTTLINLANNYQGANAAGVQRQMAYLQYKNTKDTYNTQKDIIQKQKEIAQTGATNSEEMRLIAERSAQETRTLLDLSSSTVVQLETNLQVAEGSGDPAQILAARQLLLQARSANAQLVSGLAQAQLQGGADNPPAQLSELGRDVALKQLDLQQKALDLGRDVAKLQLALAQIAESAMYPATPFEAVVQKVHVVVGQSVNPGTPLVTIAGLNKNASITATIPFSTAAKVSSYDESIIHINGKTYGIIPEFISTEATEGLLNSVVYSLPEDLYDKVSDGQFVKIEIPIGYPDAISSIPYLPIDIVFQTQDGAYVYVARNNKVVSKKVELGEVVGKNVAVESGLSRSDQVILDRNVIEGEGIRTNN